MNCRDDNLSKVVAHHNAWASTYDADIQSMTLYNRVTLDNIRRFLPADRNELILDAGGGTGFWAVQLAKMGYRVVLADVSGGMLEKARQNVSDSGLAEMVEVCVSDIRNMPEFAAGQFGMVLCQGDPLSYCGDHMAAIREFARVLSEGGSVVASVDNRASALNWFRESSDLESVDAFLETGDVPLRHEQEEFRYLIHAFTAAELRQLFEANGFSVERLIGKPVVAQRLGVYRSQDPAIQDWLYDLELKYCDDPGFVAFAGHLEIAAIKRL